MVTDSLALSTEMKAHQGIRKSFLTAFGKAFRFNTEPASLYEVRDQCRGFFLTFLV